MKRNLTVEPGARGVWLLAWTASLAMLLGSIADKVARLVATDEDFRVSEDLGVYQDAAVAMVHGMTLYQTDTFRIGEVNFIYPPFAGIVFAPMAYVDTWALVIGHHLVSLACLTLGLYAAVRAEGLERPGWWTAAVVGPVTAVYTVSTDLGFGQVNLILMALVFADVFGLTPARFRGVGIGLAAAIKLTPLGFVLVFLVRRDWASTARVVGTVAATVVIGFLVLPSDSKAYWSSVAWDPDRGGIRYQVNNQSFTGPLLRAGLDMDTVNLLYPFLAVPLVAAVAWSAWVFHRRGWDTACVGIVGLGIVYTSPLSVQHHWFIALLAPVMLLSARYSSIAPWLMAAVVLVVANPVAWFGFRDWPIRLDLPWAAQALEALVSAGAFALIVAAAVGSWRWYRTDRGTKQVLGKVSS